MTSRWTSIVSVCARGQDDAHVTDADLGRSTRKTKGSFGSSGCSANPRYKTGLGLSARSDKHATTHHDLEPGAEHGPQPSFRLGPGGSTTRRSPARFRGAEGRRDRTPSSTTPSSELSSLPISVGSHSIANLAPLVNAMTPTPSSGASEDLRVEAGQDPLVLDDGMAPALTRKNPSPMPGIRGSGWYWAGT